MIFDSARMIRLREKYSTTPNYEVPEIVFLDRYEGYSSERELLEELLGSVNQQKQKDWLGRLVNEDPSQHIGVWFEIMLFGWLRDHFAVQVEPEILGNYPDFALEINDLHLAIEARALLISPEERERRSKFNRILTTLGSIEKPFSIILKVRKLDGRIDVNRFSDEVSHWLDTSADQEFKYKDDSGNIINLSSRQAPNMRRLGVLSVEWLRVAGDVLRAPLKRKAEQHKALRGAGYPYVIAVFLEPSHLSADEVSEAWIGKTNIVYDVDTDQVVEEKFDETGVRFFGKEIVHQSVTGILVFKVGHDEARKTRFLQSWYMQNPHARVTVSPEIFPVESRFVVVGQDDEMFEMKWVK
jgi:hypothetical protein